MIRFSIGKDDEELLGMARSGEVDITFVQLPVHDKEFEHVTLLEDEYVLVVRAGKPRRVRRRWTSSRRCR